MAGELSRIQYQWLLSALFGAVFLGLAIAPADRMIWLAENILVLLLIALLVFYHRTFPLSKSSLTAVFLFLCLHELGAHFTYPAVPYSQWTAVWLPSDWTDSGQRNHYDRFAHFFYGLFLAFPLRQFSRELIKVDGFWAYGLPITFIMASSMFYEICEWLAAGLLGAGQGEAFLGAQGDSWDAQKDMALATGGAVLAMMGAKLSKRWRHPASGE